MKNQPRITLVGLVLAVWVGCLTATAYARSSDLVKLLKLFGIGYIVKEFDDDINDFINRVTLRHNARSAQSTKVVPIVSIGRGGYIGAAQVTGTAEALRRVKAVAQGELDLESGDVRLRALIPVDTTNPTKGIKGVSGVGVTAMVDFRL
jgi:hypothetical protein